MDLEQYACFLVRQWNSVVTDDDMTIIVGDVGTYCDKTKRVLHALNGKRILVMGNHDIVWGSNLRDNTLFHGTHMQIQQNGILIKHHPEKDAVIRCHVSYMIHGHHHRYDTYGMFNEFESYKRDVTRFNCAADLIGHKPRTLQELITQKELLIQKLS